MDEFTVIVMAVPAYSASVISESEVAVAVEPVAVKVVRVEAPQPVVLHVTAEGGTSELLLLYSFLAIDGGTPSSRYAPGYILDGGKP